MPKLVNNNSHPVRVQDSEGILQRIRSGQVVDADGAYADRLTATAGVDSASSDDVDRWDATLERQRTRSSMPGDGSRLASKMALGPARAALRQQAIVAPLQRVIGDDAAPQGPPSGTITTRMDAATSGNPGDLKAFAQGEEKVALGEKIDAAGDASRDDVLAGRATGDQIHNAQVDNAVAAEEAAKQYIAATAVDDVPSGGSGEPLEGDYDEATSKQLGDELKRRGLDVPRTKPERIEALEADDGGTE